MKQYRKYNGRINHLVKRIKPSLKRYILEILILIAKLNDLYELFGLRSTKYLRVTCTINMRVNQKKAKCKGFTFALVPAHVQKGIP